MDVNRNLKIQNSKRHIDQIQGDLNNMSINPFSEPQNHQIKMNFNNPRNPQEKSLNCLKR